jgi:hypothetical protein
VAASYEIEMKKELNLDLFFAYKYKEGANHRVRGARAT